MRRIDANLSGADLTGAYLAVLARNMRTVGGIRVRLDRPGAGLRTYWPVPCSEVLIRYPPTLYRRRATGPRAAASRLM